MPSIGSIVSFTSPKPLTRMNAATAAPIQPSSIQPVKWPMTVETSTAVVAITSLRLSSAVAVSVLEPIFRPMCRLNRESHTLTRIEPTSTASSAPLTATGSG